MDPWRFGWSRTTRAWSSIIHISASGATCKLPVQEAQAAPIESRKKNCLHLQNVRQDRTRYRVWPPWLGIESCAAILTLEFNTSGATAKTRAKDTWPDRPAILCKALACPIARLARFSLFLSLFDLLLLSCSYFICILLVFVLFLSALVRLRLHGSLHSISRDQFRVKS